MIVLADEKVFHTIQGEGKYIGYPTVFVRLSRCNLRCAWLNANGTITRCDTPHTSFMPEINKYEIDEIAELIHAEDCEHVCISGGEPYFQKELVELVHKLRDLGHFVTIETNGTIYRDTRADFISISPKLSTSSADPDEGARHERNRLKYDALASLIKNHDYQFKFVVNSYQDVKEIKDIRDNLLDLTNIDINDKIWLMPQGIKSEQFDDKLEDMAEICKANKWKLTDRLHIRIWGQKKGV